ncbi:guanine nucleotide binding protein, alpha subunit [Chiua virens]|nr:guanine nucleotide binding protein, alpha subunit [Chiua virens]
MGNCISSQDGAQKERSDAIDRQLEEDSRRLRKECKILLLGQSPCQHLVPLSSCADLTLVLGSSESGKSTIVKQMKIIHQNGFTDEELLTYRAQATILAMRKLGLDCIHPHNHVNAERIFDYRIDPSPSFEFSPEIAEAIDQLWKDPIIPQLMDHTSQFYLMDSAVYFFTDVLRIGAPKYLPTENNVLRAHLKSTGITETRFMMGQLQIHMFDVGGQRPERKKWIHCFESVTSIIFCTALSEYDQVLLEEKNQNRMAESLILFESVINSRWFLRTSIILFLNKIDVFKTKLPKVPLERYFPEYSGGADLSKAAKYILWRFMQTNRARLSVYPQYVSNLYSLDWLMLAISLTQATDTTNIRLVFAAVKEMILQNALKNSGIL